MNCLQGEVKSLSVYNNLTLASIKVSDVLMKSIVIETPDTCAYKVESKKH